MNEISDEMSWNKLPVLYGTETSSKEAKLTQSSIGHGYRNRYHCVILFVCLFLAIMIVVCVVTPTSIWLKKIQEQTSEPQLGHRGDTILLGSFNSFSDSKLTVTACDQAGDSPHIDYLYLVTQNNVTVHQLNEKFESTQISQDFSSATTGLVDYMYLIKGSVINYTICLGSLRSEMLQGSLFIFDNDFKFSQYKDSPELGKQLSIFSEELEIGNNNHTNCLSMVYEAPKTSYYFVSSQTPGGIFYTFNYTKHVLYYNHSDYKKICSIYEEEPCEITVPGSLFSSDIYLLLAYVRPNVETTAVQNHICTSVSQSNGVIFISGLCGLIGTVVLIISLFLMVVKIVACYRRRRIRGYIRIQNSPPSYDAIHRTN